MRESCLSYMDVADGVRYACEHILFICGMVVWCDVVGRGGVV